jgi:L-threonine-O-3-phosphate decarboxylase
MMNSFAHGGNTEEVSRAFGIREEQITDFSSNVNPFDVPRSILRAINSNIRNISRYPDRESLKLKVVLGKHLNIDSKHIVIGNGSVDLIYRSAHALKPKTGLIGSPAFGEYEKALSNVGAKIEFLQLKEKDKFELSIKKVIERAARNDILFLCNPNNPTGMLVLKEDLRFLIKKLQRKKTMVVLDEAFIELAEDHSLVDSAAKSSNLLVLRSMTKFFGLAGLRLGYAAGPIELIKRIQDSGPPWPVNIFAQAAGEAVIQDEEFKNKSMALLLKERVFLYQHLCRIRGLKPFQSRANFILVKIQEPLSSGQLQKRLIKRGLLIRDCSNFHGLNNKYIRVAVRKREENLRLIGEIEKIFDEESRK